MDVLNEAAVRSGIRLQWVHAPKGARRAFVNNDVDMWPLGYYRPGEYPLWHQTRPWSDDYHVLVWDLNRIPHEPKSWNHHRIASVDRLAMQKLVDRWFSDSPREVVQTRRQALEAVCRGHAGAALVDLRMVEAAMLDRPPGMRGRFAKGKAAAGHGGLDEYLFLEACRSSRGDAA